MTTQSIGDRFKHYESTAELILPRRLPVLVRLDGHRFSRLTRSLKLTKPFDDRFNQAMEAAAIAVLDFVSGGQLAFVQSDEITILLRNDQSIRTDPFLANRTQKLASLLASRASVAFNSAMREHSLETEATFDARAFIVPKSDVNNAFLWRQQDAYRNAIQGLVHYGLKELIGRKAAGRRLHRTKLAEQIRILEEDLRLPLDTVATEHLRGRVVYSESFEVPVGEVMPSDVYDKQVAEGALAPDATAIRSRWTVDRRVPDFQQNPEYIERFLGDPPQNGC